MRIDIECPKCRETRIQTLGNTYYNLYISDNSINPHGHIICIAFLNYKFDLLFETSLKAIKDMYYREAVATLASSLERFYEYVINVIMVDNSDAEKYWKFVSNQSERQLGAFYYLFIQEFGNEPNVLSEKLVSFRNKVIHKGYIPTREETIEFCNEVYNIIKNNYKTLRDGVNNKIDKYKEKHIETIKAESYKFLEEQKNKYKNLNSPVENDVFLKNISTFLFSDKDMKIEEYINREKFNNETKNK